MIFQFPVPTCGCNWYHIIIKLDSHCSAHFSFNCNYKNANFHRSIVWLQTQRDVTLERQRAPGLSPRREDPHEFRVGRLKHERVKVPRGEQLLDWAMQVMKIHADRKSILEVCKYSFSQFGKNCYRLQSINVGCLIVSGHFKN